MSKIIFAKHAPKTLQTASAMLTAYRFDLGTTEGAAMYAALVEGRAAAGVVPFKSHIYEPGLDKAHSEFTTLIAAHVGMPEHVKFNHPGGAWSAPVTIELDTVFDNQMNSAAPLNARLFDWSHNTYPNRHVVSGHYVESAELQQARATTCACGYCGKQYENGTPGQWCIECIESPYLDVETLPLLRLLMVNDKRERTPMFTDEERAELLPIFEEARTRGITARGKARKVAQRAAILADYEKTVSVAAIERDGKLWCNDNGIDTSLVIYYSHTKKWAFNWQERMSADELERLRGIVAAFPFAHDIKPSK